MGKSWGGWGVYEVGTDRHVCPIDDLREHVLDRECWCNPSVCPDDPGLVIHNSLDGREDYEEGRRKPD